MYFMNGYEIEDRADFYRDHPTLGPATRTLRNLRDATNANSDGWAYWPKPVRAAAQLIRVIEGDSSARWRYDLERPDATADAVSKAYRPIKAFRTRSGLPFEIVEL